MRERLIGALLVVTYAVTMVLAPKDFYISLVYLLGVGMVAELFSISGMEDAKTPAAVIFSYTFFAKSIESTSNFSNLMSIDGLTYFLTFVSIPKEYVS